MRIDGNVSNSSLVLCSRWMLKLLAALLALGLTAPAAERMVSSSPELARVAREAAPGDRILVAPGEYAAVVVDARGAEDRPIVIAGADPSHPPVFRGLLYVPNCAWLTFRDLAIEMEGAKASNALNADDGGDGSAARGLRFERIRFNTGRGNALKLAGVDDFVVSECVFEGWSETALNLVGCHRGLIENSRFVAKDAVHHGVQIKGGSSSVVVRSCEFKGPAARWINIGGGTGDDLFRPRDARYEAADVQVEKNRIEGGLAAIAFDAAVDSQVRGNLLSGQQQFVFRILNSARFRPGFLGCRNGLVEDNVVQYRSDEIEGVFNMGYGADWRSFELRGNLWHDEILQRIPRWRGWWGRLLPSLWDLPAPEANDM